MILRISLIAASVSRSSVSVNSSGLGGNGPARNAVTF